MVQGEIWLGLCYHRSMSKYARQKGHDLERSVAKDFQEIGYTQAITKRKARGGDWSVSDDGGDLVHTGDFVVQCKRLRNYVSVNTIEEIKVQEEHQSPMCGIDMRTGKIVYSTDKGFSLEPKKIITSKIPLLISQANNKPAMAVLPWKDLKEILRALQERE